MADKLHYPDVFTQINIPDHARPLAEQARSLFDLAHIPHEPGASSHQYLAGVVDSEEVSQVLWKHHKSFSEFGHLALTLHESRLVIGMEHRMPGEPLRPTDPGRSEIFFRKSLEIGRGRANLRVSHQEKPYGPQLEPFEQFEHDFHGLLRTLSFSATVLELPPVHIPVENDVFARAA